MGRFGLEVSPARELTNNKLNHEGIMHQSTVLHYGLCLETYRSSRSYILPKQVARREGGELGVAIEDSGGLGAFSTAGRADEYYAGGFAEFGDGICGGGHCCSALVRVNLKLKLSKANVNEWIRL